MIDVVIKFLYIVSMDVVVHVRRDPDEKNKSHGDPIRSVKIGSLEFSRFHRSHDVVSKMSHLVKVQKDSTNPFDYVVRIDVEIDLVGIQGQTRHATAPIRDWTHLRWRLLLHRWLRLGCHETSW